LPADPLGVRAACRRVVEEALEVRLGSLESAVAMVREAPVPPWDSSRHYSGDHLTEYILVLDTLNFSFWGSGRGYWQLAESLRDAFNSGDPLWDGERLQALDENGLTRLIGEFPMAGLRLQALHELAALAQREAGGSIAGLVPAGSSWGSTRIRLPPTSSRSVACRISLTFTFIGSPFVLKTES